MSLVALAIGLLAVPLVAQIDSSRIVWQVGGVGGDTGFNGAVLTPDASWIVTAGDDGMMRVWSVRERLPQRIVAAHTGRVRAVVLLNDSTIATGGDDSTLRFWSWPGLTLRRELRGAGTFSRLWTLAGDTSMAAIAYHDHQSEFLVTVDLSTGDTSRVATLSYDSDGVTDVDPTSGRALVAYPGEDSVHVVDVHTGARLFEFPIGSWGTWADIAADGDQFVVLDGRGRCAWRRLSDGALVDSATYSLSWGSSVVAVGERCLVFGAEGFQAFARHDTAVIRRRVNEPYAYGTAYGGYVGGSDTVWMAGTLLRGAPYQERFATLAFVEPTGEVHRISWLSEPVRSVTFIDGDSSVRVGTPRTAARLGAVTGDAQTIDQDIYSARVIAIDGQYESHGSDIPESGLSGRVVYRRVDGEWIKLVADHLMYAEVGVPAPGGNYHVFNGLWQRERDTTVAFSVFGPVMFSYDATMLATGRSSGGVLIYRTSDVSILTTIETDAPPVGLVFSRDGQRIAVRYRDSSISIYDVAGGTLVRRIESPESRPTSFVFSARGTHLIVGSTSGAITAWEIATGTVSETLQCSAPITCVDISADGRWIVAGADDMTVTMWKPRGRIGAAPLELRRLDGEPMLRAR